MAFSLGLLKNDWVGAALHILIVAEDAALLWGINIYEIY